MSRPPTAGHARRGACWLLALACGLPLGCERKSGESKESGSPAADAAKFKPAKLTESDLRGLPMPLEMKLTSAQWDASNSPGDPDKVAALAALEFAHGFPAQAALCFEQVSRLKPEEFAWRHAAGLAYEKAGQRNKAVAAFEAAIALQKTYTPAYLHLADLVADDLARAEALYRQAADQDPLDARAQFGLGRILAAQGRQDEALKCLTRAVGLAPDYPDAQRALGELLKSMGKSAEADAHLRRAASSGAPPAMNDPMALALLRAGLDAEVLCADAQFYAQQRQFDRAEAILKQATDIGATAAQSGPVLGIIRALQQRPDEALAEFRRALETEPESIKARLGLAQVLTETGKTDEAERVFREILAKQPDQPAALERLAALLARLGRTPEALQFLRQTLAADPDNATLHYLLAQFLANQDQKTEALEQLRQAVALRPEFLLARQALAQGLHSQGDLAGAQTQWQAVLQLSPKFAEAYLKLAGIALEEKNPGEVRRILREGLQQVPESPDLANHLAWTLATDDDPAQRDGVEAVRLAEKACTLTQNASHTHLDTLAAAYAEVGRFPDAIKAANKALELATKAKDAAAVAEYRQRLTLYTQNKPYHAPE